MSYFDHVDVKKLKAKCIVCGHSVPIAVSIHIANADTDPRNIDPMSLTGRVFEAVEQLNLHHTYDCPKCGKKIVIPCHAILVGVEKDRTAEPIGMGYRLAGGARQPS